MKRALGFVLVLGCHHEAAAVPPTPVVVPSASTSVAPSGAPGAAPSTSFAAAPPAGKADTLPAPKPTTIALARTGDAALDEGLARADAAFEAGELDTALAGYEAARKSAPKRAAGAVGVARVRVARAAPSLGYAAAEKNAEVSAAAKELARAAEVEPAFGPAHVELGRAWLLLGDAPRAEAALRKGVALLAAEPEAHSALGVALLAGGKTEEALGELARARDLDPGSAARRGNLGTVLFLRGRVAEAIEEYRTELRLVPDDARAHSDLGTALLAQNDFQHAIPELERAVALEPKRATFRSNLGYAHQLEGRLREAIEAYRAAIALDPKLASAWINLATALARDPATRAEARQALQKAAALDPTDPRVKANLEELDALERQAPASSGGAAPAKKPTR